MPRPLHADAQPAPPFPHTRPPAQVGTIDVTQLAVAAYLYFGLHQDTYALVLMGLILPQIFFQFKFFLPDPIANDVKYQAAAQPFLVFGLLTTGLAIGHANAVAAAAGL